VVETGGFGAVGRCIFMAAGETSSGAVLYSCKMIQLSRIQRLGLFHLLQSSGSNARTKEIETSDMGERKGM
jgi:hypothetical protein